MFAPRPTMMAFPIVARWRMVRFDFPSSRVMDDSCPPSERGAWLVDAAAEAGVI
jgi:hypothetical protein